MADIDVDFVFDIAVGGIVVVVLVVAIVVGSCNFVDSVPVWVMR